MSSSKNFVSASSEKHGEHMSRHWWYSYHSIGNSLAFIGLDWPCWIESNIESSYWCNAHDAINIAFQTAAALSNKRCVEIAAHSVDDIRWEW